MLTLLSNIEARRVVLVTNIGIVVERRVQYHWSFEEKTFVKESLGTVLEILTKILRFAHG